MTDFLELGVRPCLPVRGVSSILGSDLAGETVLPLLEVLDTLPTQPMTVELFQKYPTIKQHPCRVNELRELL